MIRIWRAIAGLGGLLSVAAGAIAAHLPGNPHAAELLRTGALYGMVHAAALLAITTRPPPLGRALVVAGWGFAAGIVLFSFSLFGLALSGIDRLALATPVGGLSLMVGWLAVLVTPRRRG